jgi:hypothetical protein
MFAFDMKAQSNGDIPQSSSNCDCNNGSSGVLNNNTNNLRPLCDQADLTGTLVNVNQDCNMEMQLVVEFFYTNPAEKTFPVDAYYAYFQYAGTATILSDEIIDQSFRRITFDWVAVNAESGVDIPLLFNLVPAALTPQSNWSMRSYSNNRLGDGTTCTSSTFQSPAQIFFQPGYAPLFGGSVTTNIMPFSVSGYVVLPPATAPTSTVATVNIPTLTIQPGLNSPFATREILLAPGMTLAFSPGNNVAFAAVEVLACSNLGNGITIGAGGTFSALNTTFSDCRRALSMSPGSTLSLNNVRFTDNYIGLHLDMSAAAAGSKFVTIGGLSNVQFSSPGPILPAYAGMPEGTVETRGFAGIYLNDYHDFNVGGGNTFTALTNGLVALNSDMNIRNMTFSDINRVGAAAYPFEGRGISLVSRRNNNWVNINSGGGTMTFDNVKTGIYALGMATPTTTACTMTNVEIGIDWQRSPGRDINLRSNNISPRRYGIRSFQNEPLSTVSSSSLFGNTITIPVVGLGNNPPVGILANEAGVSLPAGPGWAMSGNNITLAAGGGRGIEYNNGAFGSMESNTITNGNSGVDYIGIKADNYSFTSISSNVISQTLINNSVGLARGIFSSGGWANAVSCNRVSNHNTGIQFLDMADYTDNVAGNCISNYATGLKLGDFGVGNAIVGDQRHTGNVWDLTPNALGGIHYGGSDPLIAQSEFFVDEAENPQLNPPVDPSEDWFVEEEQEGNTFSCSSCSGFPGEPGGFTPEKPQPTGLDAVIVAGTLPTDAFQSEVRWKGRYRLYRKLLRQPAMATSTDAYATFHSTYANQSEGQLAYVAEERGKLYALTTQQQTDLTALHTDLRDLSDDIRVLDQDQQQTGTNHSTQINNLMSQRNGVQQQYDQLQGNLRSARLTRIGQLQQLNQSVNVTLIPVLNHRTVNAILLTYEANDGVWATTDEATLAAIATQCPSEGGDAVYEARAVLRQLQGVVYNDRNLCQEPGERRVGSSTNSENLIQVYPNPSSGIVQWNTSKTAIQYILVYDVLGTLVLERNVESQQQIDLSHLPNGLYRMVLSTNETDVLPTTKTVVLSK